MAFDAKAFAAALEEIEVSKGISKETVLQTLEESLTKGYKKELGGDDADVRVTIDFEKGIIDMGYHRNIVEEVLDDFLEITMEDAKALVKEEPRKYSIVDGTLRQACEVETLRKGIAMSIKSMMKQKFAEVEKGKLMDEFKDKIGTLITGKVEKADDKGLNINIGKTSVYLPRKDMIGDEKFLSGQTIKLYVVGVASSPKTGARIDVSRANEGFLVALFHEEIHEIYDGTITIKGAAREAGKRSKVAVYSQDVNVDPAGACIGPNGSRIQKVVGQLGNGQVAEKIDVVAWSENPGLFIIEALKPAKVLGVKMTGEKSATAVVNEDSLSLAIGKAGVNARLAVKLTGYNIDIKTESEALEAGIEYQTIEELQALEMAARDKKIMEANMAAMANNTTVIPGLPQGYVDPLSRTYEEETNDFDEELQNVADKQEEIEEIKVEEVNVEPIVVEVPTVEEVKVEPVEEKREVKTTTSLEELEKNLESESNKQAKGSYHKNFKKNNKKAEEEKEEKVQSNIPTGERMSIYTEEELAAMEAEDVEEEYEDEDVDYDEYDEYYDDDNR